MSRFLRTAQYYLKVSLVGLWCAISTFLFYLLSFPFNRRKWLSWAYAKMLNFGVRLILGVRVEVKGRENMIDGPAVVTMNHQSNFDPLLQGPVFPKNAIIIGKKELLKIPLWGRLFKATNNIIVDRKPRRTGSGTENQSSENQSSENQSSENQSSENQSPENQSAKPNETSERQEIAAQTPVNVTAGVDEAIQRLKEDDPYIWIFPEGTRSQGNQMGQFKRGAFIMAIQAQVPIIPMVSKPLKFVLDVPKKIARGGQHEIRILPPISTLGMTLQDLPELISRCELLYAQAIAKYLGCSTEEVFG